MVYSASAEEGCLRLKSVLNYLRNKVVWKIKSASGSFIIVFNVIIIMVISALIVNTCLSLPSLSPGITSVSSSFFTPHTRLVNLW